MCVKKIPICSNLVSIPSCAPFAGFAESSPYDRNVSVSLCGMFVICNAAKTVHAVQNGILLNCKIVLWWRLQIEKCCSEKNNAKEGMNLGSCSSYHWTGCVNPEQPPLPYWILSGAAWALGLGYPLFAWNLRGRPKPGGRWGLRLQHRSRVKFSVLLDETRVVYTDCILKVQMDWDLIL